MTFSLSDYGAVFSTRPLGAELRDKALAKHSSDEVLTISFADVQSISYSFADEFLGPLMLSEHAALTDVPPQLHRIISGALKRRGLRISERDLFGVCA